VLSRIVGAFTLDGAPRQRMAHAAPAAKPAAPVRTLSAPARRTSGAGTASAARPKVAAGNEEWETF